MASHTVSNAPIRVLAWTCASLDVLIFFIRLNKDNNEHNQYEKLYFPSPVS